MALARLATGDAESHEADRAGARIDQHVRRLDVLVHDAALVQLRQRGRQCAGHAQEKTCLHRLLDEVIERLASRVCQQQQQATVTMHQCERPNRPLRIKFVPQRVLMFESLNTRRSGKI